MEKNTSSLALYFADISRYPILTHEEELELGRRIKEENDDEARDRMVCSNLRLVVSIAKSYRNNNMDFEDLIAYGNTGLMKAVGKYDYTLGYKFSTCATPWIKQAITQSIAERSRAIRIPAHIIQSFSKLKTAVNDLTVRLDREPTHAEIAQEMGITEEDLADIYQWRQNTISLSSPLGDDSEDTLEDISADEHDETPAEYAEKSLLHEQIINMLSGLKPRVKDIIKLRFGIMEDGDDPDIYGREHTLEDIGKILQPNITRERVRQILMEQLTKWKLSMKDGALN